MPTITIVFRGLLVLNQHQADGEPSMEIGILSVNAAAHDAGHDAGEDPAHDAAHDAAQVHTPRIMTLRNGVREETFLLDMEHPTKLWKLIVDSPVSTGITLRQNGPFDRLAGTGRDDDFRWVINLESAEFPYGNIDQHFHLDRTELRHVIEITSGEFYTRLKSPVLARTENGGAPQDFGAIAGVTGLEIKVNSGGARLIGENEDDVIFEFSADPNVVYEIANSPSDVAVELEDHFPHYYEIFQQQPRQKFGFERPGGSTAPNPALCGKIFLGEFGDSLASEGTGSTSTATATTAAEQTHGATSEHCHDQYTTAKS
jgi:hypothetical protein